LKESTDSRAEIPVINEELLDAMQVKQTRKVHIQIHCMTGDLTPAISPSAP